MPTANDLLTTLAQQAGLPLTFDANGWCMFEIDGLWVALHRTPSHLIMHGMIGAYPDRLDDATFWRDALFRNTATLKTAGAAISMHDGRTLILTRPVANDLPDINSIGALSVTFVDTLRGLAAALPMADTTPLPSAASDGGMLPIFGGPYMAV
ncbi:type III secretion system chaperone [Robbsia andropogonis]|uniref:type III secretion system chaperone n=1 Tax=Robbsia andropogonis TaxID=28092 RepID=UPI00209D478C|nr:type III secretion system chaperone [Robbsia andropogonis]MCP1120568.1 type III secretion system chaperone [Robbsia andropogonis]MCP1130529.1 type III secretion system chaperone [Robbsia andropogonis]